MALWNPVLIEAVLARPLTDDEATRLHCGLGDMVEAEAAAYCNRPVSSTTIIGERHTLYPDNGTRVSLRATPVLAISQVRLDGVILDSNAYREVPGGIDFLLILGTLAAPPVVEVDYTAGLDVALDIPGYNAIGGVLASRLARMLRMQAAGIGEELTAIEQEGERLQLAGGPSGLGGWTVHEESVLARFRRRTAR